MAHGFSSKSKGKPGQLSLLDGEDDPVSADFLATPYDLVHQLLEARPDLAGQHAVEPCAGNGSLIRHSLRACRALGLPEVDWNIAIELRNEGTALRSLPCNLRLVLSPCDTTTVGSRLSNGFTDRITLAWTNLPWFDGVIPICRAVWRLWPKAHLWGLCSTFFYLRTDKEDRAAFLRDHRPEDILQVPHRVRFEGQAGAYNQPVAWHHWLPGGERGAGHFDMLG